MLIALLFLIKTASFGIELSEKDTMIYLFPGQGSDERLFKHLVLPPGYDTLHISYLVPEKHESLAAYAMRFIEEINCSSPFILMGVSLGGMICTELSDTLAPLRTILISNRMTKAGARLLQGIVEPDRKHDKETFKEMLKAKDPLYLK